MAHLHQELADAYMAIATLTDRERRRDERESKANIEDLLSVPKTAAEKLAEAEEAVRRANERLARAAASVKIEQQQGKDAAMRPEGVR